VPKVNIPYCRIPDSLALGRPTLRNADWASKLASAGKTLLRDALAIIRYDYLSVEYVSRLGKR
jgi:hypothetical protein